jgi:hypothetical protein
MLMLVEYMKFGWALKVVHTLLENKEITYREVLSLYLIKA